MCSVRAPGFDLGKHHVVLKEFIWLAPRQDDREDEEEAAGVAAGGEPRGMHRQVLPIPGAPPQAPSQGEDGEESESGPHDHEAHHEIIAGEHGRGTRNDERKDRSTDRKCLLTLHRMRLNSTPAGRVRGKPEHGEDGRNVHGVDDGESRVLRLLCPPAFRSLKS